LCFPHAGGAASAFRALIDGLPELSVCALEYPGHWTRLKEQPYTNLFLLVKAVANELKEVLEGRFAFLGFSYGSVVAFELARELRRRGATMPEHLFMCAARAPQQSRPLDSIRCLPDTQLVAEISRRYGALPKMVLEDEDVLRLALAILRVDLAAFETYIYEPEPPLPCPITTIRGHDDPMVDTLSSDAWRQQTAGRFSSHVLLGDHFFLNTSRQEIFTIVRRDLMGSPLRHSG